MTSKPLRSSTVCIRARTSASSSTTSTRPRLGAVFGIAIVASDKQGTCRLALGARDAHRCIMANRNHRPQKTDRVLIDDKIIVVRPLPYLDRMHNRRDVDPDLAAMRAGMAHGGTIESRAGAL